MTQQAPQPNCRQKELPRDLAHPSLLSQSRSPAQRRSPRFPHPPLTGPSLHCLSPPGWKSLRPFPACLPLPLGRMHVPNHSQRGASLSFLQPPLPPPAPRHPPRRRLPQREFLLPPLLPLLCPRAAQTPPRCSPPPSLLRHLRLCLNLHPHDTTQSRWSRPSFGKSLMAFVRCYCPTHTHLFFLRYRLWCGHPHWHCLQTLLPCPPLTSLCLDSQSQARLCRLLCLPFRLPLLAQACLPCRRALLSGQAQGQRQAKGCEGQAFQFLWPW